MSEPRDLLVRCLGRQPYEPVWRAMQAYTDQRDGTAIDELWLLEHDPVYTLGQAGNPAHLIRPNGIPLLPVDRGGQITYHGPGQLVAYPLLDLRRLGLSVRGLVQRLEQVVIDLLEPYGIHAERREKAPGVYVRDAKIASLGLRVRRGCSLHGLALNVDTDLGAFADINPCGFQGLQVTRMSDAVGPVSMDVVRDQLLSAFLAQFGYRAPQSHAQELP